MFKNRFSPNEKNMNNSLEFRYAINSLSKAFIMRSNNFRKCKHVCPLFWAKFLNAYSARSRYQVPLA